MWCVVCCGCRHVVLFVVLSVSGVVACGMCAVCCGLLYVVCVLCVRVGFCAHHCMLSASMQRNLFRTSPSLQPLSTWQDTRRAANREALLSAVTSNSLIFRTVSSGDIQLFAPSTYQAGSSVAHLRLGVYPANQSLMLPFLSDGEVLHNPGAPTFRILESVGHILKPAATAIASGSAATTATATATTSGAGSAGGGAPVSTTATAPAPSPIGVTSAAAGPMAPVVTSASTASAASAARVPCVMLLLCAWCMAAM